MWHDLLARSDKVSICSCHAAAIARRATRAASLIASGGVWCADPGTTHATRALHALAGKGWPTSARHTESCAPRINQLLAPAATVMCVASTETDSVHSKLLVGVNRRGWGCTLCLVAPSPQSFWCASAKVRCVCGVCGGKLTTARLLRCETRRGRVGVCVVAAGVWVRQRSEGESPPRTCVDGAAVVWI